MKVERRHELEKNALAAWIASVITRVKPYQNAILGSVLLALVVLLVYSWLTKRSSAESAAAWDELLATMPAGRADPQKLEKVVADHPGTTTAHWAGVLAGEAYLAIACDELFADKAEARDHLENAREDFRKVLEETRVAALRERATYGLAQADEAAGDLDKAIESWSDSGGKQSGQKADRGYRGVLNLWPNGTYAVAAEARLKDLERAGTKRFYDDFARWEPRPKAVPEGPGKPGLRPPTDLTLPEDAVFSPPDLEKEGPKKSDDSKPAFPEFAPEKPKGPAEKPASPPAKPDSPGPAPEKPVAPEAPAKP